MDFPNERYVRLYTRDTLTWERMRHDGQALFCLLLRKVDRSGVLEIGDVPPAEALSIILRAPIEFCSVIDRLVDLGAVERGPAALVLPRFLEAQESPQSDAQRKRESRARRRDGVTKRDLVTDRDASVTDRDDSVTNHPVNVTTGHTGSQVVTPILAEPSLAKPPVVPQESPTPQKQEPDLPRAKELARLTQGGRALTIHALRDVYNEVVRIAFGPATELVYTGDPDRLRAKDRATLEDVCRVHGEREVRAVVQRTVDDPWWNGSKDSEIKIGFTRVMRNFEKILADGGGRVRQVAHQAKLVW